VEIQEEILRNLRKMAEQNYKEFQAKLCPGDNQILGIRIPELRTYAKEIVKQDWGSYLKEIGNTYLEEHMLYGFILGYAKMDWVERMQYMEQFVPRINNWAICDCCTSSFKFIEKNRETFWPYLEKYAASNQEFENRFALICLLDHYLQEEYLPQVFESLDQLQSDAYYVSMAKAWLLAELEIKYPSQTEAYFKKAQISDVTCNRAIQKMLDSYRIPKEKKDVLRAQKRK